MTPLRQRVKPRDFQDLPFVGMEHVEAHTSRLIGSVPASTMRSTGIHFHPRDVLYGRLRPYLNKVHLASFEGIGSAEFIVLSENASIDAGFLRYRLSSTDFVYFATHQNEGDRPRVDFKQMGAFALALPPLAEQRRIVAALEEHLSDLDAAVAGMKRARANARRFLEATREEAVHMHPLVPFGELLAQPLANGRSVLTSIQGFPVLRLTALRAGRIDLGERKMGAWTADEARPHLVHEGDFLIARGNGSKNLVGRGGLIGTVDDPVAYPDTLIRARPSESRLSTEYLRLVWDSRVVRRQIEDRARTTAGIYKINQRDIEAIRIPVPDSLEQQRAIAHALEARLVNADRTAAEIDVQFVRAKRLRQAILKHAFEGKLVPQDPNDEPAPVLLDRIRAERAVEARKPRATKRARTARPRR